MRHLLVTNDFPPKIGGIQNYLWELWRRLPPESFAVYTTPYSGADAFDAEQPFRVIRSREPVLLPRPGQARTIDRVAAQVGAELVMLYPALPIGHVGPSLDLPYGVVLHGAEVTVPGRLPGSRALLARVLRGARVVVAAGGYAAAEGERAAGQPLPVTVVPPGVDVARFHPIDAAARVVVRRRLGLPEHGRLVLGVSRLVPRKGFDALIEAVALVAPERPDVVVAICGSGRDEGRLRRLAELRGAPVHFLGRVADADLPALHASADVFAMLCRTRWAGLEQEGFGIVFVEAAAAGVAQLAGDSGGAAEAVIHGETGLVVDHPDDPQAVAIALARLLDDEPLRLRLGAAARQRVERELTYEVLAGRLGEALGALP